MTPGEAAARAEALLGRPMTGAVRLTGGLLNHVFRVSGADGRSVVLKHAPPHVAAAPQIALDPRRAAVEALALAAVGPPVAPRLLAHEGATLVLEDLGPLPHLGDWLAGGGDPAVLDGLGRWLRRLHESPVPAIDNRVVQQTRLAVQYEAVEGWLAAAGVPEAAVLGGRAVALGRRWLERGPAFVMGDLWPPSVLVAAPSRVHLIDWELAVAGWPAQDLGHLVAHLALGAACDGLDPGLGERFLAAYGPLWERSGDELWVHAGAELLARSLGPFARPGLTERERQGIIENAVLWLSPGAGR